MGIVRPGDTSWFRAEPGVFRVGLRPASTLVWLSSNDILTSESQQSRGRPSIAELAEGLAKLRQEVAAAQEKLDAVLRPRAIELRNIPREQAKAEVLDFFIDRGRSYPSDAARDLRLDPILVVDLCDELEREGLIGD
jgi:hypothetical protein